MPMMAGRINAFYGRSPSCAEFAPDGIESELRRLHYDTANATFAPAMAALMKLVPVSQITYGTDYPYFKLDQIGALRQSGLAEADLAGDRKRQCDPAGAAAEELNASRKYRRLRPGLATGGAFAGLARDRLAARRA